MHSLLLFFIIILQGSYLAHSDDLLYSHINIVLIRNITLHLFIYVHNGITIFMKLDVNFGHSGANKVNHTVCGPWGGCPLIYQHISEVGILHESKLLGKYSWTHLTGQLHLEADLKFSIVYGMFCLPWP